MSRYTFSFKLKLTITLLQKLAKLYVWNVKQNEDGIDKNTLHRCYSDYMTSN